MTPKEERRNEHTRGREPGEVQSTISIDTGTDTGVLFTSQNGRRASNRMAHGSDPLEVDDFRYLPLNLTRCRALPGNLIQYFNDVGGPGVRGNFRGRWAVILGAFVQGLVVAYEKAVRTIINSGHDEAVTGQLLRIHGVCAARHTSAGRDDDKREFLLAG